MSFRPKPFLGQQINWAHPLTDGLVHAVLFNESGSLLFDVINNKSSNIPSGISWGTQKQGRFLECTASSHINLKAIANSIDLEVSVFALCRWDTQATGTLLLSLGEPGEDGWAGNNTELSLGIPYGAAVRAGFHAGDGESSGRVAESANLLTNGEWCSFGGKRDSFGYNHLYHQGKYIVTASTANTGLFSGNQELTIAGPNSSAREFDGGIALVYIYNKALTDAQFQALHLNPYAMFQDPYPIELFGYVTAGVTLEQEGFRFRDDDAGEAAATWLTLQDVDITRAKETNTRLRILVNATGDPAAKQFKLQYKKTSDSVWRAMPES